MLLPTAEPLPLLSTVNNETVVEDIRLTIRCCKVKFYYDRHAKSFPELEMGQTVKLQPLQKVGTRCKAIPASLEELYDSTDQAMPAIREAVSDGTTKKLLLPEE